MRKASTDMPADYLVRVRSVRGRLARTQAQLAERIGVSFGTVNRRENGREKPTRLAWQQIVDLEAERAASQERVAPAAAPPEAPPRLDFATKPAVVAAVAEANHLA